MLRGVWKNLMLCGLAAGGCAGLQAQETILRGVQGAVPSQPPTSGLFSSTAPDEELSLDDVPPVVFDARLPPDVWYAEADYLVWWVKKAAGPAVLATFGDAGDATPGALGQPGTTTLLGGGTDLGAFSGGRLTIGAWDAPEQTVGWELSGFLLENKPNRYNLAGQGREVYLPHNDFFLGETAITVDPGDDAFLTQYSHFGGLQGVLQFGLRRTETLDTSVFGGVRYQRLAESFGINVHSVTDTADETLVDSIRTRSQFFGGYFGGKFEKRLDLISVRGRAGVGLGWNQDRLAIAGSYENVGAAPLSLPGGIYAQEGNSGVQNRSKFAATTDFSLGVALNWTRNLRFTTDYTFSYWSRVVRPGEQLDRNVNSFSTFGGPLLPPQTFHTTDFYAQGLSFGMELHY